MGHDVKLDELLAAVHAAPADDGPRLVLADYLMERGDPRGELVHLQCALARLAEYERGVELVATEQALLARRVPPRGAAIRYVRGFASATIEAHRAVEAIPFLTAELWIDQLRIEGCGGGGAPRWDAIGRLIEATMDRVTSLELTGVVWYWYEADWDDTGRRDREEIDESGACVAMVARLPPRPATLVTFAVPDTDVTWAA